MARTPTGSLATHFTGEETTLARLLTITRRDEERILLTDHDEDINIPARSVQASGTLTLADVTGGEAKAIGNLNITVALDALNGESVTIGARVYLFETAFSDTADSVLIGVDRSATLLNLTNAINNGAGEGTTYGTGTVIHADVTATAPSQSSSSGVVIDRTAGTVVGNMDNQALLGFGGTNEMSFDGNTNQWSARSSNHVATAGAAFIGKDFTATPVQVHSAKMYGTNNRGWWNPGGVLSLEMFFELRAKNGAAPATDAAYLTEGTVLGTVGPFINPAVPLFHGDPIPTKTITSSDNVTFFDHVWVTLTEPRTTSGNYINAETEFNTVIITTGAGDMGLEAKVANDEGNAIATTETLTNGSFGGGFMTGGSDPFKNIIDGETVTIGTTVYQFKDTMAAPFDIQIGVDANASLLNLDAAIDLDGTPGVEYFAGTTEHPDVTSSVTLNVLSAFAEVGGVAGNLIATTETVAQAGSEWGAATLGDGDVGEDGLYLSTPGFVASSSLSSTSQGIEGLEITTIEGTLSQDDIASGKYNEAQCSLEYVNWASVSDGFMTLFAGIMGQITNTDESDLAFEIQGKFSKNRSVRINTYQPNCRADLGDAACGFDIAAERRDFTITVVNSGINFETGTDLPEEDDFWKLGIVRFITGNNAGVAIEVSSSLATDGEITMFLPAPLVMQVGDTGEIWPGCDKTINTCINRYGNVENFRGEPFAPNEGALFAFKV